MHTIYMFVNFVQFVVKKKNTDKARFNNAR